MYLLAYVSCFGSLSMAGIFSGSPLFQAALAFASVKQPNVLLKRSMLNRFADTKFGPVPEVAFDRILESESPVQASHHSRIRHAFYIFLSPHHS